MLDMMSYNPGPTREGATTEVYSELRYDYPSIYPPYLKSVVKKVVYSYEEGGLGSEAGWLVGYKKDVLDKVHGILKNFAKRKRHIIVLIRCIGVLCVMYKKIVEKRYAPGGIFEQEAALEWNPLLLNLNPNDTLHYIANQRKKIKETIKMSRKPPIPPEKKEEIS